MTSCFSTQVDPSIGVSFSVKSSRFSGDFEKVTGSSWVEGNSIRSLSNGDAFFPPMLAAIRGAEKSITFETFAFVDAPVTQLFSQALAERARAGVPVKMILDNVGSAKAGEQNVKLMRDAGVELYFYHPINFLRARYSNNRTHRKILVVDGKLAYTGGAGFAHAWTGDAHKVEFWRDNQYEVKGPAVAFFQKAFCENWEELTKEQLQGRAYFPELTRAGKMRMQVLYDDPWNTENPIADSVLTAINASRESLILQQAYFVPNRDFREVIIAAARRGVKVQVMVPNQLVDSKPTRYVSQNYWKELLEGGVRIFQYETSMLHSKLLIADDKLTIIGSGNFDNRSFFINDEMNLCLDSPLFAGEQMAMFERDKGCSREVTLANLKQFLEPSYRRFFSRVIAGQL